MKRSVLRISACALLFSSMSSVLALTPRKRADIQDLIRNISNGSVSGSGIISAIQKLNITNKDDLNDPSINRKDGGLNQAAYNALKNQGYNVTSTFVVQDVMSGDEDKLPTISSRSTLVRVPLRTVLKGHDLGPVIIEDANILTAKSMLNTPIEKQQALDKLNLIIIDNISNLPANDQTALTTFKNDLEKNKYNTLSVFIPTTQVTLSPQVKAKIEAALKTPIIVEEKDEPTASLPEQIKDFGKSVSDAAARDIMTQGVGVDLGKQVADLQAQFEAKQKELANLPADAKKEEVKQIVAAAEKAGEEAAKAEAQAKAAGNTTKASIFTKIKNSLYDMIKWNFGVKPVFIKEEKNIPEISAQPITLEPFDTKVTQTEPRPVIPTGVGVTSQKRFINRVELEKFNAVLDQFMNQATSDQTFRINYEPNGLKGRFITNKSDNNNDFTLDDEFTYYVNNYQSFIKDQKQSQNDKDYYANVLKKYLLIQYQIISYELQNLTSHTNNKVIKYNDDNATQTTKTAFESDTIKNTLKKATNTRSTLLKINIKTPENILSEDQNKDLKSKLTLNIYPRLSNLFDLFNGSTFNIMSYAQSGSIDPIALSLKDSTYYTSIQKNIFTFLKDAFGTELLDRNKVMNEIVAYSMHAINEYCARVYNEVAQIDAQKKQTGWIAAFRKKFGLVSTFKTPADDILQKYNNYIITLDNFAKEYLEGEAAQKWQKDTFNLQDFVLETISTLYSEGNMNYTEYQQISRIKSQHPVTRVLGKINQLNQ